MKQIVLVAETGSDINPALAAEYNIKIVPMHVSFDHETMEDGAFPVEKIVDYYEETGKLPKTSGSTPGDFETAFDRIHAEYPDAQLLYLAYSAVTTCSMQSAVLAAEERDYVTILDTKQVSAGQCNVVIAVAELLQQHPDWTMAEAVRAAEDLIARAKMCFMPENLEFLRAGGRVSNVAFLGAKLLNLHPVIEILDGKLVATKKYRGKMENVYKQYVTDCVKDVNKIDTSRIVIANSGNIESATLAFAKGLIEGKNKFDQIIEADAGCTISSHCGPKTLAVFYIRK